MRLERDSEFNLPLLRDIFTEFMDDVCVCVSLCPGENNSRAKRPP